MYNVTQPAIPPGYRPIWLGLRWCVFTCVGWKVTLCDPTWDVTPRGCEMEIPLSLSARYTLQLPLYLYYIT